MGNIFVNEKDIVVPGEVLAEGMDYLPVGGASREGEKIIANQIGMVNINARLVKVIPLRGKYMPKKGDVVIGKIVDMTFSNWFIDIDCPSSAVLGIKDATEFIERGADLSQVYSFGDVLVARIINVTRGKVDLTMRGPGLRKLGSGRIISVGSSKVPRIIGREGSMISVIKEKKLCRIIVGQNGTIWIQGEPQNELAAVESIEFVNKHSHQEGLTETITKFLDKRMEGIIVPKDSFKDDENLYRETRHEDFHREHREFGGERRDFHRGGGGFHRGGGFHDRGGFRDRGDFRDRGGGFRDRGEFRERPEFQDRGELRDRGEFRDRDSMMQERKEMRDMRKNLRTNNDRTNNDKVR